MTYELRKKSALCAVLGLLALAAAQNPGALNKSKSRKLVREAEKQLAAFIRSLPEPVFVKPNYDVEEPESRYLEHRGSPLVGKICEFRCRWEFVTLATDMIPKEADHSEFVPTDPVRDEHSVPTTMRVLTAAIPTSLIRLYSFNDMFPYGVRPTQKRYAGLGKLKGKARTRIAAAHDKRIRKLRHQLRMKIPPRAKLPDADPPKLFDAIVKINSVEFERTAEIPTMIIHASLIISADLGINP